MFLKSPLSTPCSNRICKSNGRTPDSRIVRSPLEKMVHLRCLIAWSVFVSLSHRFEKPRYIESSSGKHRGLPSQGYFSFCSSDQQYTILYGTRAGSCQSKSSSLSRTYEYEGYCHAVFSLHGCQLRGVFSLPQTETGLSYDEGMFIGCAENTRPSSGSFFLFFPWSMVLLQDGEVIHVKWTFVPGDEGNIGSFCHRSEIWTNSPHLKLEKLKMLPRILDSIF